MKYNKIPSYLTKVVCTDGSTINVDFPYEKSNIFLNNDFNNNPFFISPLLVKDNRGSIKKLNKNHCSLIFIL